VQQLVRLPPQSQILQIGKDSLYTPTQQLHNQDETQTTDINSAARKGTSELDLRPDDSLQKSALLNSTRRRQRHGQREKRITVHGIAKDVSGMKLSPCASVLQPWRRGRLHQLSSDNKEMIRHLPGHNLQKARRAEGRKLTGFDSAIEVRVCS